MSVIKETTFGVAYEQTIYHIGVAFIHENRDTDSSYGHSFRVEHSHKSGSLHIKLTTNTMSDYGLYIRNAELTTSVPYKKYGNKSRVMKAALAKIEESYCRFIIDNSKDSGIEYDDSSSEQEVTQSQPDPSTSFVPFYYKHTNSKGVTYILNMKDVVLRGGKETRIYYFSKDLRPEACALPDGMTVNENPRNGFLTVRKGYNE